jgi:hypothetical protein
VSVSVTAQEVLGHLVDVDYPADKAALVAAAEAHGAPDEVVRALRAIPPSVDYRNDDEVVRCCDWTPSPDAKPTPRHRRPAMTASPASPRPPVTPSRTASRARTGAPSDRDVPALRP